ncbi:hypothetical protein ACFOLC_11710 [Lysobacter cavernae]|uniref:Phosphatase PAP2 family protein n=1 Tax=Lysobacter cavernae TaxID=1685901 RepID=A0ABV7RPV0_9GAMM
MKARRERLYACPFPVPSRHWLLASAIALTIPGPALADAVTDWNAVTNQVIGAAGAPPQQFRVFAMVHIAAHDALNAIDPRYRSYAAIGAANPNASPAAAVARAARDVLVATLPSQVATVNTAYANYIAGLPACPPANANCIGDGVAIGALAADAILDMRHLDGSQTPHLPYTLGPGPGVYQPTLPTPPPPAPYPQFGNWGNLLPFALVSSHQFRPGHSRIFILKGKAYAADYNEVKAVGSASVRNATPDSEESRIARFWPGGGGNLNGITRVIVADYDLDLWENARLFALMNMAVNDGLIATFEAKYHYNFWRPYTAIRWLDDGNPATTPDPNWTSYIVTPPYPDYTCGLPNTVGAFSEVLRDFFGSDEVPFTFTATGLPPTVTRSYTSLSQAANESASARVYGGIHFRTGCIAAVRLGEKVGRFVFKTQLKPLKQ